MTPPDDPKKPGTPAASRDDDPFAGLLDDDFDLSDDGESLGEMLGAPPPLPPPEAEVLTSAPRLPRAPRSVSGRHDLPPLPEPSGSLPHAPTDDEIFGSASGEDLGLEIDAAFGAVADVGPPSQDEAPDDDPFEASGELMPPVVPEADEFGVSTRVAEAAEAAALALKAGGPRRGPAVVRRDQLPAIREAAEDLQDFGGSTKIADLEALAEVSGLASPEAEPPAEPPPVQVALDESFYDDIEIGGSEPETEEAPPAPAAPPPVVRRVTQNVVRRPASASQSGPLPSPVAAVGSARVATPAAMAKTISAAPAAEAAARFGRETPEAVRPAALGAQAGVPSSVDNDLLSIFDSLPAASPAAEEDAFATVEPDAGASAGSTNEDLGALDEGIASIEEIGASEELGAGESAIVSEELGSVDDFGATEELAAGETLPAFDDDAAYEAAASVEGAGVIIDDGAVDAEAEASATAAEAALAAEAESYGADGVSFDEDEWVDEAATAIAERPSSAPPPPPRRISSPGITEIPPLDEPGDFVIPSAAAAAEEAIAAAAAPEGPTQVSIDTSDELLDETTRRPPEPPAHEMPAVLSQPVPHVAPPRVELPIDPSAFRFPATAAVVLPSREDCQALCDLFERELALADSPARQARLRVEAGRAAEEAGDRERARDHYEEAAASDPIYSPAARAVRRLALRLGDFPNAIRWLDAEIALASAAERGPLAAYRADLLVASGEQDLARVAFGELTDERPDDLRSLMAQIELAYADDRDDELIAALLGAAARVRDPSLAAALNVLRGRLHERGGDAAEAERAFQGALDRDPGNRAALLGLVRLYRRAGRATDAAAREGELAGTVTEPSLRAAIHRRRGATFSALGEDAAAVPPLVQAVEASLGDPLVLERLADAYERAGHYAEAAATLGSWVDHETSAPRRAQVLRRLAALQAGPLGDPGAALATLRLAVAADPGDIDAAQDLETAALAAGDLDGAVALLRAGADADPEGAVFDRMRAARLLRASGREADAIVEIEAAREGVPGSVLVADALARAYLDAGRRAEAARLLIEVADAGIDWRDTAYSRERAARAAESAAERVAIEADTAAEVESALSAAESAWTQVLVADPNRFAAHAARVRLASRRGDRTAQLDALAAQQGSTDVAARAATIALARQKQLLAEESTNEQDPALEAPLDAVLALDPSEPRATAALVALAGRAGRWGDVARRLAERADAIDDGLEREALRYRAAATLVEREADFARAQELLQPVRAAHPAFAGGAVLAERASRALGDAGALAAELAIEAGVAEPAEPGATPPADSPLRYARLVRLAEILDGRVGDPARAAAIYREALDLRPSDPLGREGFGRIAAAAGEIGRLADLALADLKRAEESEDLSAKVAAYEELAHIDGDLRGDIASSTLAWEASVELDGTRVAALRVLERTYLAEGRGAELAAVYGKLAAALEAPADAASVSLEGARVHELAGADAEALAAYRRVLDVSPTARMALFRLEARARDTAALDDLARFEDAIAAFFAPTRGDAPEGDARGQAAFLTRAGEIYAELGQDDAAISRFRAAAEAVPGYTPALRAWRRVALRTDRWGDVVDACEREAESARSDEERVRLYHLAGVAAMDHHLDGNKALDNLRRVLALDPRASGGSPAGGSSPFDDAFRRLRTLLDEQGRYEDLAQLLGARVEIEPDRRKLIEYHQALASLHRDFLGDRDRAKTHLRAVLARDPGNLAAVSALSDIAWEQGEWAEAAEALIARAKLERDPAKLKRIFYCLGVIYAERLPDRRWALKSFERVLQFDPHDEGALEHLSKLAMAGGDWRLALGATERLVALGGEPAAKITQLHRIGKILEEGFQDKKRAEEAYRRAIDIDPANGDALNELVDFYNRARDLTSMRVHLDRVAGHMRARLTRDPFDGVAYHVLSRTLGARARAGVVGSIEAARCAAEIAHTLGAADDADRALAAEALRASPSAGGLGNLEVDEVLFHPSIPNGFRQIFRLLYDTLAKQYPPDLRRWGAGRNDRLPPGHPVRDLAAQVAGEMGVRSIEVYQSGAQPHVVAVELTDPISLVLGAQIAVPENPAQVRFAVGRALKLATSYVAVPARLTADELGVLLAAVIRQYDPGFTPPGLTLGAVAEAQQRLSRLIPKRLRDELVPYATEITGLAFDHQVLWRGVQHTGNRAGLVASGSALAGIGILLRQGNHRELTAARHDAIIGELLRFAVSDEHCEIRRALVSSR